MDLARLPDDELLALTAARPEAFGEFVRRYRPGETPAIAWLFGIARKVLLRSFKRRRVEDRARRRLEMPPLPISDELVERSERMGGDERVQQMLDRLPAARAQAVRSRVLEDAPYDRIASELRCSESVVRQRVSRGLAVLRHFEEEAS